jgi:excisionase family DNA binding protein
MTTHEKPVYGADRRLLRVDEVAERLAVSRSTVNRLVAAGELRRLRIGGSIVK